MDVRLKHLFYKLYIGKELSVHGFNIFKFTRQYSVNYPALSCQSLPLFNNF